MTRIGVLALQGAIDPHVQKLRQLNIEVVFVRLPRDLDAIDGLIMPGGESTTMLKLIDFQGLWEPLGEFAKTKSCWGICAGSILLAKSVSHPQQKSLGVMDIDVSRNAYGRQLDSFIAKTQDFDAALTRSKELETVFIRAPRFTRLGPSVLSLVRVDNETVMVRDGRHLASSFHPELSEGLELHAYFINSLKKT